jgi:hypothetical protein
MMQVGGTALGCKFMECINNNFLNEIRKVLHSERILVGEF